jgi:GTPase Era involved in 16S rRNA processing
VGKTSSGKTTTINYLMGKKMINIQITTSVDIKGKIYESHKYRIDAETPLEGFKIGQESKSETLIINCIESSGGIGYFCDMPGF